jgi:hypothetical protein
MATHFGFQVNFFSATGNCVGREYYLKLLYKITVPSQSIMKTIRSAAVGLL